MVSSRKFFLGSGWNGPRLPIISLTTCDHLFLERLRSLLSVTTALESVSEQKIIIGSNHYLVKLETLPAR